MANPFANPSVLTNLIKDMDELQLKRRPLQPHAVRTLPKPQKQLYVTMLVAILINQNISKEQARLLTMLLDSMDLDIKPAQLYDEVTLLGKAELQAFCELCDEHALAPCFLMDALVLCRLDTSINHDQQRSIAELVSLLAIPEHTLSDILHLANEVISPKPLDLTFDEDNLDYGDKLYIEFDYNLLKPWHEFSYQPLSVDNLQHELTGGKWLVKNVLELNHDCKISNAKIVFGDKAKLTVNLDGQGDGLKISDSYLQSADIKQSNGLSSFDNILVNDGHFTLYDSNINILNSYFFNGKSSYSTPLLTFNRDLRIESCFFSTKGRVAIKAENSSSFIVEKSKFNYCGFLSKESGSGAIITGHCYDFKCLFTSFLNNISTFGRDIYVGSNRGSYLVKECNFNNLEYLDSSWLDIYKSDTSILVDNIDNDSTAFFKIENTTLTNSKIYIKVKHKYQTIISDSILKNSPVLINMEESNLFSSCNFDNNGKPNVIRIKN